MISRFRVAGFKPFGPSGTTFDFGRLTFLVGENGSGKTSLLQALALLAQSAGKGPGLAWKGDWAELPPAPHCIHRGNGETELVLDATLQFPPVEVRAVAEEPYPGAAKGGPLRCVVAYRRVLGKHEEWDHLVESGDRSARRTSRLRAALPDERAEWDDRIVLAHGNQRWEAVPQHQPPQGVLVNSLFAHGRLAPEETPGSEDVLRAVQAITERGAAVFRDQFAYLATERGPSSIERGIPDSAEAVLHVGRRGSNTLRLLARLWGAGADRAAIDRISRWSAEFQLGDISAGWSGGKQLGCNFRDPVTGMVLSFEMSGFGSIQMLPVIAELFASPPDSVIAVEEPEISLHPKAIAKLPVLLAEAVSSGKQVIVSTHSQALLGDLHRAVATGHVAAGDIRVLHLERSADGVAVRPLPISVEGHIEGWVPSFTEAEDASIREWLPRAGE